jgi:ABC-type nitrate/sulfonate/bicarbonate transport system substrate-binding protein
LRTAIKGTKYTQLVPLVKFNPVSVVSSSKKPIRDFSDLQKFVLGTNPQSGTYPQFEFLMRKLGIASGTIREYPVGFGGAAQLISGEVDAFLSYTTNQAVDVQLRDGSVAEIMFETLGVRTFGLVLAIREMPKGITREQLDNFILATIQGYALGGENPEQATSALLRVEPTLNRAKVFAAISKVAKFNSAAFDIVPEDLDDWVTPNPSASQTKTRIELVENYKRGMRLWKDRR